MKHIKTFFQLIKETFTEWNNDHAPMVAAALAYYTAFSLAPLIIIVVAVLGLVANQGDVQAQIIEQIQAEVGPGAADVVNGLIQNMSNTGQGIISSIIGVVALIFGALAVFNNLQIALDRIWDVDSEIEGGGIKRFVMDKILSFSMILVIGFLLVVSLVLSTALSFVDGYLFDLLPGATILLRLANEFLVFMVTTLLFMFVYKVLPHAQIQWRDVFVGAAVTSLLFTVGRIALGIYLTGSAVSSTYGAAGALALILLWVYYSAQIVLFGAEFTQVYSRHYGSRIKPDGTRVETSSDDETEEQNQPRSQQTAPGA